MFISRCIFISLYFLYAIIIWWWYFSPSTCESAISQILCDVDHNYVILILGQWIQGVRIMVWFLYTNDAYTENTWCNSIFVRCIKGVEFAVFNQCILFMHVELEYLGPWSEIGWQPVLIDWGDCNVPFSNTWVISAPMILWQAVFCEHRKTAVYTKFCRKFPCLILFSLCWHNVKWEENMGISNPWVNPGFYVLDGSTCQWPLLDTRGRDVWSEMTLTFEWVEVSVCWQE